MAMLYNKAGLGYVKEVKRRHRLINSLAKVCFSYFLQHGIGEMAWYYLI